MPITAAKCPVCGQQAYRNARGQMLAHTTAAEGGRTRYWSGAPYKPAEICPGSTKGARP